MHTSKHSTTPTLCCRLNSDSEGKYILEKDAQKNLISRVIVEPTCENMLPKLMVALNVLKFCTVPLQSGTILSVHHKDDMLGCFVLILRQLVSEEKISSLLGDN